MPGLIPVRKRGGERRHHGTLKKGVVVVDETGGGSETWVEIGRDWMAVDPIPFVVDETKAAVLYKVSLLFRQDLVDLDDDGIQIRVEVANKTLKMLALENPEERRRDLILHCARVEDSNT